MSAIYVLYCSEPAAIIFILQWASWKNFYIAVCYLARILFTPGNFPTTKKDRSRFSEESNIFMALHDIAHSENNTLLWPSVIIFQEFQSGLDSDNIINSNSLFIILHSVINFSKFHDDWRGHPLLPWRSPQMYFKLSFLY